jgi:hypothetical protein
VGLSREGRLRRCEYTESRLTWLFEYQSNMNSTRGADSEDEIWEGKVESLRSFLRRSLQAHLRHRESHYWQCTAIVCAGKNKYLDHGKPLQCRMPVVGVVDVPRGDVRIFIGEYVQTIAKRFLQKTRKRGEPQKRYERVYGDVGDRHQATSVYEANSLFVTRVDL